MPPPDFSASRRQLRRSRLQDALGLEREGVNVTLHRNRLIEQLAIAADNPADRFDALSASTVDTVVSLALADIDENALDTLVVVLLCVRVLAADGQFARLSLLADRLSSLSRRLTIERPYLAAAVEAFALALKADERSGELLLEERLGLSEALGRPAARTSREHLSEILMALSFKKLLGDTGQTFTERAKDAAIESQDGLLYAYTEAALAWHGAVESARPSEVLNRADPTFSRPVLARYLERLRIQALYPAQLVAIQGGATLDQSHVVSLPTSSGKTLIAEFRIIASLVRHPGSRAIYVAPYRMLARQVERNFRSRIDPLGFSVRDLGSGFDPILTPGEWLPDVAICTPERLDALLRASATGVPSGAEATELFSNTKVIVFDELQLVGRQGRGPRFEMIIARLRAKFPSMFFLGLSAASQGADDLAMWLTGSGAIAGATRPTGTLEIVWETNGRLRQRVEPRRPTTVAELPRSKAVDDAAALILRLNARYRPVLAVEPTRQYAESLASKIAQQGAAIAAEWRESLSTPQLERLNIGIQEVRALLGDDHPLARLMEGGIAFHHAGVPTHALVQIEQLAAARLLRVVCATTTVAEGADLPFRVVVIPHLTFPGASRRLERDLYLNIIGRAGRANVSVEGLVFVLDSDAVTLRQVIKASLWSTTTADRIRGRLSDVDTTLRNAEEWTSYYDVQSQVMGWLGDGNSYVENQAEALAENTLSWRYGTLQERRAVVNLFEDALSDLEQRGYALAASPYQLTTRGRTARLTGLSAPTVFRLEQAIERSKQGWLLDLPGIRTVSPELAAHIARLVLESVEVVQNTVWLRRTTGSEEGKWDALRRFTQGDDRNFYDSTEYRIDVELLSSWILGKSYVEIARSAPIFERANSLFGGRNEPKRTSDAAEYVGKMTYPASWVWSGARILSGESGEQWPAFIRNAIDLGLPSEAATQLVTNAFVTRSAALAVSALTGPDWNVAREWLMDDIEGVIDPLNLTTLDRERILGLRERLLLSDRS
jgi:superfamily II DNA/RNA helicase